MCYVDDKFLFREQRGEDRSGYNNIASIRNKASLRWHGCRYVSWLNPLYKSCSRRVGDTRQYAAPFMDFVKPLLDVPRRYCFFFFMRLSSSTLHRSSYLCNSASQLSSKETDPAILSSILKRTKVWQCINNFFFKWEKFRSWITQYCVLSFNIWYWKMIYAQSIRVNTEFNFLHFN